MTNRRFALLAAALIFSAAAVPLAAEAPPVFVTLGTAGGPVPDRDRSQPANAVILGNDVILFDAGDGVVARMAGAGIRLDQVRAVFLSHLHLDHTAGLAGVIGLRWMNNVGGPFRVYGPPGTRALVDGIIASMAPAQRAGFGFDSGFGSHPVTVDVVEIADPDPIDVLPGVHVTTVENTHYSFAAGSPASAQNKAFSFRLDAGGRSIVYTGDTGPSEAVTRLARNADLLVSEVQDLELLTAIIRRNAPNMPKPAFDSLIDHLRRHHLSAEDVGRMATAAGVRRVVLTHLGPAPSAREAHAIFLPKIRLTYDGPVVVAEDLDRF